MTKFILVASFILCCTSIFSQDSKDMTVKKIKIFLHQYQVNISTGKTGNNPIIYYNKVEKIIDIDGYQIPLQEVKTTYYISQTYNQCVSFDCKLNDCITKPDGDIQTGFAIPFLTKKNCYDFIELINQLKK